MDMENMKIGMEKNLEEGSGMLGQLLSWTQSSSEIVSCCWIWNWNWSWISWKILVLTMVMIFGLMIWWYEQRKRMMSVLRRCGIPGPEPALLTGNLKEAHSLDNVLFDGSLISKFSKICGYYLGTKPVILTSCPHFLEFMQRKEKRCFLDRPRKVPGGISPDPNRKLMLGNLCVEDWKPMRRIMVGAFRSSNLKLMLPEIQNKMDICLDRLREDRQLESRLESLEKNQIQDLDIHRDLGRELDLYPYFQDLTLDIIGAIAFGFNSDIQRNKNDRLLSAIQAEFSKNTGSFLTRLCLCLPGLAPVVRNVREVNHRLWERLGYLESSELWDLARNLLVERRKKRQQQPERSEVRDDEGQGSGVTVDSDSDLLHHLLKKSETDSFVSDSKIVANTVLIFEAAFETTSACLAFTVHLLAHHPEVQSKIQREIRSSIQKSGSGSLESFEVVQGLKYLEAVILESLRIFPPQTTFIGRSADQDLLFIDPSENGDQPKCRIPKGVHIQAALCQLHHDPEHWDRPMEFRPERFLEPQPLEDGEGQRARVNNLASQFIYQAFGHGPRECLGKGFALMSIKYMMARLLYQYKVVTSPRTEAEGQLKLKYKVATMTPLNGSFAYLIPRHGQIANSENRQKCHDN